MIKNPVIRLLSENPLYGRKENDPPNSKKKSSTLQVKIIFFITRLLHEASIYLPNILFCEVDQLTSYVQLS